jgi:hypothetical protein
MLPTYPVVLRNARLEWFFRADHLHRFWLIGIKPKLGWNSFSGETIDPTGLADRTRIITKSTNLSSITRPL